jgi:hypothetical protein
LVQEIVRGVGRGRIRIYGGNMVVENLLRARTKQGARPGQPPPTPAARATLTDPQAVIYSQEDIRSWYFPLLRDCRPVSIKSHLNNRLIANRSLLIETSFCEPAGD